MNGEVIAWRDMVKYNKHDVALLFDVYNRLKSWTTSHPNLNLYQGSSEACPICGENKLQRRGLSVTRTMKRQRYQCQSCAGWSNGEAIKVDKPIN